MTLFEALTGGVFDRLNWQHSGEFDQNFSKKSNARRFARAWAVLELTGTLDRSTYYVMDRSMLLSRFSTRFEYQYGISGCKLQMRTESQTAWFVVFGSRISSSFTEQNLKVMNMSRTLLLLVSTLQFFSIFVIVDQAC